ncbi:Fe2+-dependent dioxygenase [Chromatiales bacterium (ex Bugula neritina AB1)]|nr:Fe2+-dependent dioxygenase [Chromatiales bacterium (ex Bugula neritina AB1)]
MLNSIPRVLTDPELSAINEHLQSARWISGKHSAGKHAVQGKSNEEMDQSCDSWSQINRIVANRLYQHPQFQRLSLPVKLSAAFVSRYRRGMAYGPHIDDPVMGAGNSLYRADIAITVFLSDPDSYTGGELSINTPYGATTVKLDAGSAITYPAASLHEVLAVENGERIACVMWAQSMVRDAQQREILADLDDARQALRQATPQAQITATLDRSYSNLVRMWAEV